MSAMVEPRADLNVRTVHTLTTYDLRQELNRRGEFELVTPPLDASTILPGVTRASVLALC